MSARLLEDLTVKCPQCGGFPTSIIFGARDWLARQRPYDFVDFPERGEELSALIENARSSALGRLWNRVKRATGRTDSEGRNSEDEADEDEAEADEDDDIEESMHPRDRSSTVTRERIDADGDDEPWPCERGECDGEIPITWNQIIAGHEKLGPSEIRWLESYVRAKDLIRLGLFRGNLGFRTALGLIAVKQTGELPHAFGGTIAPGASPVFIASAALARRVGALDPETVLRQMGGDESCKPATDPDADSLPLPIYYEGPKTTVDIELPLEVSTIAEELQRDGATPLRGFGVLRLLEVDWVGVQGKLAYLEFEEPLRETMAAAARGERW